MKYMRSVILFRGASELEDIMVIPPCAGYYTNISIQTIWSDMTNNSLGINYVYLSTERDGSFLGSIPDSDTEALVEGNVGRKGTLVEFPTAVLEDGTTLSSYRKHLGKKRIYVAEGKLLQIYSLDNSATPNQILLIQADFVPFANTPFRQMMSFTNLTTSDDFNSSGRRYRTPVDFKNSALEVRLAVTPVDALTEGRVVFRYFRSDQDFQSDTLTQGKVYGDVWDEDFVSRTNMLLNGVVGVLDFVCPFDNAVTPIDQITYFGDTFPIGQLAQGSILGWDVYFKQGGDANNTMNVEFEITGITGGQGWSEEADFFAMSQVQDLNNDEVLT